MDQPYHGAKVQPQHCFKISSSNDMLLDQVRYSKDIQVVNWKPKARYPNPPSGQNLDPSYHMQCIHATT